MYLCPSNYEIDHLDLSLILPFASVIDQLSAHQSRNASFLVFVSKWLINQSLKIFNCLFLITRQLSYALFYHCFCLALEVKGAMRSNFNLFIAAQNKIVFFLFLRLISKSFRLLHRKIFAFHFSAFVAILPFFKTIFESTIRYRSCRRSDNVRKA